MEVIRKTLFLGVVFTSIATAGRTKPEAPKEKQPPLMSNVHTLMYKVLAEVSALQPLVASEKRFTDPQNENLIKTHLNELTLLSGQVIKMKELQSPAFRVSGATLDNHIRTAASVFASGHKEYARWMLQATPVACASCHTQVPEAPKPLWSVEARELKGSDFEKAEFLFGTRNYNPALELYTKVIADYSGKTDKSVLSDVETSLRRKLVIFVRSKNAPGSAVESFQKDLNNKALPSYVQRYLKSWIQQLETAAQEKPLDVAKASDKDVLNYAQKRIDPKKAKAFVTADNPQIVSTLMASGALYEYLDTHPKSDATPDILYWLALTDYSLNKEFFFSLGNMYLLQCIQNYPSTAAARRCYDEYAREIEFMYTGSSGTKIPPEAKQSLKALKALIDSTSKPVQF